MINTAPLRRTTLHFSHIGFTDARTFITDPCHSSRRIVGSSLPYIPGPNHSTAAPGLSGADCFSERTSQTPTPQLQPISVASTLLEAICDAPAAKIIR